MSNFVSNFFGPLDKKSCSYFLFLTIFFFIALTFALFAEFVFLIKNFRQLDLRIFTNEILLLLNFFIMYFVNRLLYTMCSKSLA